MNLVVAVLGDRIRSGDLHDLQIVVASRWTEAAARAAELTVVDLNDVSELDLAIDGADEIDPQGNMIKGGGGALLRERIVLAAGRERLIVADESKLITTLGERWPLPVEVVRFGWRVAEAALRSIGGSPVLRMDGNDPFVTDEGNLILDCTFGPIADARSLDQTLRSIPGVMDHGLFLGMTDRFLIGTTHGVQNL